jgi:adenine-specific DNA-methyltransferase
MSTLLEFTKCDVFTPDHISRQMASYLTHKGALLEPAVGTGQLLTHIPFSSYSSIDIYDIKQDYLNKCPSHPHITSHCSDFITTNITNQYDAIILNPPFIKIQDLPLSYRKQIRTLFPLFSKGNIDLYYIFLYKSIECLKEDGSMVSITPNSYLYTKSALSLRKHLIDNTYIKHIIDFKTDKVFKGVSVYCCITVFTKQPKTSFTYNDTTIEYSSITNSDYNIFQTHPTSSTQTLKDICKIRNGIATLRDAIFIHPTKLWDEPCWKPITTGKEMKWCIYPYNHDTTIIPETKFKSNNPNTYNYLCQQKDELAKRDKGKKKYAAWYAYGRT